MATRLGLRCGGVQDALPLEQQHPVPWVETTAFTAGLPWSHQVPSESWRLLENSSK